MLIVTDEMMEQAARSHKNLRLEMALALYTSEVFTLRKAAEYAGVAWLQLAEEAKKRNAPAWDAITPEEFELEAKTL